jgi:pimeloyl-ACP methyl ester carboxylesterase
MAMRRAILIGSALVLGGFWLVGSVLTGATNSAVARPVTPASIVSIPSAHGIELAGTYWPGATFRAPAILLLHGNGSNRGQMSALGAMLHQQGYAVLAIDFRGHGQSTPAGKSFGLFEAEDAHAAPSWLRRCNPGSRIGAIGFSLGGAASLLGAQGPLNVDALVLEGIYPDIRRAIANRIAVRLGSWPAALIEPFLSFQSLPRFGVWPSQIAPVRAVANLRMPVMVVGGEKDVNTPPDETRSLYKAIKGRAELQMLAGVDHDELGSTVADDLKPALLAFLDRNLRR